MRIRSIEPEIDWTLLVTATDGRTGRLDIRPWLQDEAFAPLRDATEFMKVRNGGYFIEWDCGADLSADTIEARWQHNEGTGAETPQPSLDHGNPLR